MNKDWVSAWMMMSRLVQCVAVVFFLFSLDWTIVERTMMRWTGIL